MNNYHHTAQFSGTEGGGGHHTERDNLHEAYSNEEEEEDDVSCTKCGKKPEDVLILTCDHNLCLECAALNLQEQTTQNQNTFKTVICEFCQSATVLDPESATELLEIACEITQQQQHGAPHVLQQHETTNTSHADLSRRVPAQSMQQTRGAAGASHPNGGGGPRGGQRPQQQQHNSTMNQSYRQVRDFCRDHPEEEVSYYCHDCSVPPVCPECVIHGAHQGHKVALLKKAHPQIVKAMEDLQIQVSARVDDLALQEQRLEARKREISEQSQNAKMFMCNAFEELVRRIKQKERELLAQCDQGAMELISELDGSTRLIKGRMAHLTEAIDEIGYQVQSEDDVAAATYFAQNYENVRRTCLMDSDLPQLKEVNDKVNIQPKMDMSSLDQFLKEMDAVQICLENLQGTQENQAKNNTTVTAQSRLGSAMSHQQQQQSRPSQAANNSGGVHLRRNPTQTLQNDKLSTYGDDHLDTKSAQQLTNEPSTRSIFQVAYSQKSEKQGPSNAAGQNGKGVGGNGGGGNGNPLQVSVAQTMQQLQKQKQQQAQAFLQGRQQHNRSQPGRAQRSNMGMSEQISDQDEY